MEINIIMQYMSYLLIVVGAMAFLVSVVTQVIKELPGLSKLPTSAVVFVLSLMLCPLALLAGMQYIDKPVTWYMMLACIIVAFIVALVAMHGWEAVRDIWRRTKYDDE